MATFQMNCSCGDVMKVEAKDRADAVSQLKAMMTQEAIDAHMAEKHPGNPGMTMADVHAGIERDTVMA